MLKVNWTIRCSGCDKEVKDFMILDEKEYVGEKPEPNHSISYNDVWGPGIPYGWLQTLEGEEAHKKHLFFHSHDCYKKWLVEQGRFDELHRFENAFWVA
jgi:hypothetical protein